MSEPFENNLYLLTFSFSHTYQREYRDLEFTFENPEHAVILKKVLDANPELKPSVVVREITVLDGGVVKMYTR